MNKGVIEQIVAFFGKKLDAIANTKVTVKNTFDVVDIKADMSGTNVLLKKMLEKKSEDINLTIDIKFK